MAHFIIRKFFEKDPYSKGENVISLKWPFRNRNGEIVAYRGLCSQTGSLRVHWSIGTFHAKNQGPFE